MSSPTSIGKYRVLDRLGSGGFATVWLALDPDLDSHVAIKVLSEAFLDNADIVRRFKDEAMLLRRLEGHGVVTVYGIEHPLGEMPYFVMSYADLGTLATRIANRRATGGLVSSYESISYVLRILECLEVVHRHEVVHRDIKPSNVLFRSAGRRAEPSRDEQLILADFGVAKDLAAATSTFTMAVGTPAYMAPEQRHFARVDHRADLYSTTALLFELLTAQWAKASELTRSARDPALAAVDLLTRVRHDLPPGLTDVIRRGLQTDPEERYESASAMRGALAILASDDTIPASTRVLELGSQPSEATTKPALRQSTPPDTTTQTRREPATSRPDRRATATNRRLRLAIPLAAIVALLGALVAWRTLAGGSRSGAAESFASADGLVVSAGELHSCALGNGRTFCWGENEDGKLGDGTSVNRDTPTQVTGADGAIAVVAGGSFSCLLDASGRVHCWGANDHGQLGDGTKQTRLMPAVVSGLGQVQAVAVGSVHACALVESGSVMCWGSNSHGQLGNGSYADQQTPVSVVGLSDVTRLAVGSTHSCAVRKKGVISCWGDNTDGELGNSSPQSSPTPVAVALPSTASTVSVGRRHTCALDTDRGVWCWGANDFGQLGTGSTKPSVALTRVVGVRDVIQLSSRAFFSCALLLDHTVSCWGEGRNGEFAEAEPPGIAPMPRRVERIPGLAQLSVGGAHSCGVTQDRNSIVCWGNNDSGQLGLGTGPQTRFGQLALR